MGSRCAAQRNTHSSEAYIFPSPAGTPFSVTGPEKMCMQKQQKQTNYISLHRPCSHYLTPRNHSSLQIQNTIIYIVSEKLYKEGRVTFIWGQLSFVQTLIRSTINPDNSNATCLDHAKAHLSGTKTWMIVVFPGKQLIITSHCKNFNNISSSTPDLLYDTTITIHILIPYNNKC